MASISMDLSELDMMRDSIKESKETIKDLKDTISGLENKSRVIIKTVYQKLSDDQVKQIEKVIRDFIQRNRYGMISDADIYPTNLNKRLICSLETNLKSMIDDYLCLPQDSSQYVGFDDIKQMVESELKNKYEEELKYQEARLKESAERYELKLKGLDIEYKSGFDDRNNSILGLNKSVIEKDKEIKLLNESITEKDDELKSLHERYDELEKEKEETVSALDKDIDKILSRSLFKRIFNVWKKN
jgi:hypothetical protein